MEEMENGKTETKETDSRGGRWGVEFLEVLTPRELAYERVAEGGMTPAAKAMLDAQVLLALGRALGEKAPSPETVSRAMDAAATPHSPEEAADVYAVLGAATAGRTPSREVALRFASRAVPDFIPGV